MTLRVLLAFLIAGLVVAWKAHAEDHFWISENPRYVERWRHETHCCGPSHCRRASEVGVVITQVTDGWQVAGGPLAKPEVVLAADTYETERPGGLEAWVCIWGGGINGEQVACLFMPPQGT